jgi:4'-phosphopantetheinyl transferase
LNSREVLILAGRVYNAEIAWLISRIKRVIQVNCTWQLPPEKLKLTSHAVHVWRAALEQPEAVLQRLSKGLSPDETARAGRFHFEQDRRHFIVGRGILRSLMAGYLGSSPAEIEFSYGPQNKPTLVAGPGRLNLRFNLAHSHGQALYAFTVGREIGVDLEQIRPLDDAEDIAKRFFSARDYETFMVVPAPQRLEAFFNCWTRKEAYIKALGQGLSHPLDTFDVSLTPGEPARLLAIQGDPQETSRWSLLALTPEPGYAAALMVEGQDWALRCWTYRPAA